MEHKHYSGEPEYELARAIFMAIEPNNSKPFSRLSKKEKTHWFDLSILVQGELEKCMNQILMEDKIWPCFQNKR